MAANEMVSIRDERQHAASVASQLNQLSSECDISFDSLGWEELSALPVWCLSEKTRIRVYQRLCGACYLLPEISHSIDGSLLRRFRKFVGVNYYDELLSSTIEPRAQSMILREHTLEVSVMGAGSSVLLATLAKEDLARAFGRLIGPPTQDVKADVAAEIYSCVCTIIDLDTDRKSGLSVV